MRADGHTIMHDEHRICIIEQFLSAASHKDRDKGRRSDATRENGGMTMLEIGAQVRTANGYTGTVQAIDTATYSIPFYHIDVTSGRFAGERIYVSSADVHLLDVV